MSDLKELEFLATKSKEILDKQITSYRQKQTIGQSVIAVIALFIPLFITALDDACLVLKILMLIPIVLFVIALCMMFFHIIKPKNLYQAVGFNEFNDLVNETYENVLLFEIGSNKGSFEDNEDETSTPIKYYNHSINLTIVAIVISASLLITNKFFKPQKNIIPTKIEIVKTIPLFKTVTIIKTDTIYKRKLTTHKSTVKIRLPLKVEIVKSIPLYREVVKDSSKHADK